MKIKTFPYKGSKRKLLEIIHNLAQEIGTTSIFDAFSGTGIVSAYFRNIGYTVSANDLGEASYLAGSVFLKGFDITVCNEQINILNTINSTSGWITENYSGSADRKVRGKENIELRPRGFLPKNATKLDAARDYIETININQNDKNALIFSMILAANKVFNGTNDQKSALSIWQKNAEEDVVFELPTLIEGPIGTQYKQDVLSMEMPDVDFIYLDPPYGSGVLYPACYHLNDSIALWDKPELDHSYAIPRPQRAAFSSNNVDAGGFYNKKTATKSMELLLNKIAANNTVKRTVISYSDAPRNVISLKDIVSIAEKVGQVRVDSKEHSICSQPKSMNKVSNSLNELFIVIDHRS